MFGGDQFFRKIFFMRTTFHHEQDVVLWHKSKPEEEENARARAALLTKDNIRPLAAQVRAYQWRDHCIVRAAMPVHQYEQRKSGV